MRRHLVYKKLQHDKNVKKLVFVGMLISVLVAGGVGYAGERALWVWSMSTDILFDIHGTDRADFFSFLAAPHGDTGEAISTVFMSFDTDDLITYSDRVAGFLADAHSRGIEVHFLTGDKHWGLTGYHYIPCGILDIVLNYNTQAASPAHRFDGIQFDVEPYLLEDWDTNRQVIFSQYRTLLVQLQSTVDQHNSSAQDDIIHGVAIPRWFDSDGNHDNEGVHFSDTIQNIVDYIAIMNYETGSWGPDGSAHEIAYADSIDKSKSVWIGSETISVNWRETITDLNADPEMYNHRQSFWYTDDPVSALHDRSSEIDVRFKDNEGYCGVAVHYYEDTRNGKYSYRSLGLEQNNHAPYAGIDRPAGGEMWAVNDQQTISYRIYDADNDTVSVSIEASIDNGQTWSTVLADYQPSSVICPINGVLTQSFEWTITDTWTHETLFPADQTSTQAILRIVICDSHGVSSDDRSEYPFTITAESVLATLPQLTGVIPSVIEPTYPTGQFLLSWDGCFTQPAGSGPVRYYYSLYGQNQPNLALSTTATTGCLTASNTGEIPVYVWAQNDGGVSAPVVTTVTIYPDADGDGTADQIDDDRDGDGVSNSDEIAQLTDPDDATSFAPSLRAALWELDGALANSISGQPALTTPDLTYKIYETGMFGYAGDTCMTMTGIDSSFAFKNRFGVASDITPQYTTALTVQMWIKPDPSSSYKFIPLAFEGDINKGISLILRDHTDYLTVRYYYQNGSTRGLFVPLFYPNESLFDGNWHHVAFTFNGIDHTLALYVDGQRVASTQNGNLIPFNTTRKLRLFDATSGYDTFTYYEKTHKDNSAQFYALPYVDITSCQFTGSFDDIRVTRAAVPVNELGYYVHPVNPSLDQDNDTISDLYELFVHTTDPTKSDSDNDGIDDIVELQTYFTDPARADTDLDSQPDSYELITGNDPLDGASFFLQMSAITRMPDPAGTAIMWEGGNNGAYTIYWRDDPSQQWDAVDGPALMYITEDRSNHLFTWTDTGIDPDMPETSGLPSVHRQYKVVYPR